MPQVSVIIPTYNHRDYVLATLDSVFAQTFTDYEVIVVNDGSPDQTAQVLKPLAESGRIQYVEQPNQGQAAARNRGLALARGEFVAFLDDDDLWPPDKLQWQVDVLRQHPQAGAVGGACEIMEDASDAAPYWPVNCETITFQSLFAGNPFCSPGQVLARADAVRKIGGFDPRIGGADDLDLWFSLSQSTMFLCKDVAALKYRVHATNASSNLPAMFVSCRKVFRKWLKQVPRDSRASLQAQADLYLYRYLGRRVVRKFKLQAKAGHLAAATRVLFQTTYFAMHFYRSPRLVVLMFRDLLPPSLERKLFRFAH